MPDCELLRICPFFNDMMQNNNELTSFCKENYCHGYYDWCGRYMAFKALERELERERELSASSSKQKNLENGL